MKKQKLNKFVIVHGAGISYESRFIGPFNTREEAEDYAHTVMGNENLIEGSWGTWEIRLIFSPDIKIIEESIKLDKEIELALAKNKIFLGLKENKSAKKKNNKRLAKKKI